MIQKISRVGPITSAMAISISGLTQHFVVGLITSAKTISISGYTAHFDSANHSDEYCPHHNHRCQFPIRHIDVEPRAQAI